MEVKTKGPGVNSSIDFAKEAIGKLEDRSEAITQTPERFRKKILEKY